MIRSLHFLGLKLFVLSCHDHFALWALGIIFSFVLTVQNTFQFVIVHAFNKHAVYIPILVCLKEVLRKLEERISEQLSRDAGGSAASALMALS